MKNWKRTFAIIWSGQLFSTLSSSIVAFAVAFWLSIETNSPEVLAYAMIAGLLPFIVLGLFTGVYVDRWDRKWTMILADSFIAVCTAGLALLFYFNIFNLWLIYLLLALRSVGSAFHTPAMQASVPLLAPKEELMRVAGINQMIQSVSNIAGPALGALLINFLSMPAIMMLDVVGAVIACTCLLFVKIPNPPKNDENVPHVWREIKEGLGHMVEHRGIAYLMLCITVVTFFMVPISALYPLMTLDYFKGDAFEMSVVEIAWGIGMLLGGTVMSLKFMRTTNRVTIINIMSIILGAAYWATGYLPTTGYSLFVAFTAISGIVGSIYWGSFTVILQSKIDPSALGRVFSIYDSISLLPSIPGLLATGYIAGRIGLLNAFIVAGVATLLMGIVAFFIPAIRRLGVETKGKGMEEEEKQQA